MEAIRDFSDGSTICFDRGKFDNWCVYLARPGQSRFAPRDSWYFARLYDIGARHSLEKLYGDFVQIYNVTTRELNPKLPAGIARLSEPYAADSLDIEILLSVVYAGMVAEERKERTMLGKRIKRLGMHQVLIEHLPASEAATFSKGKPWRAIAAACEERGF